MRISEILKRVLLRNVRAANAQIFLIPRPGEAFGRQLISNMLKRVPGGGLSLRIARRKERLDRERHVVVVSRNEEKLVRRGIAHDGWEKIVRQSKLLRPVPQHRHSWGGVVIVPHGDCAVKEGELVHSSTVPDA